MEDPVPAVAEADAEGETAAIFADIRAALGVGVVNLIWRHLATIPGALPWAWGALGPRYRDGSLARAAAGLRAGAPPGLPAWPEEALAATGLSRADRAAIAEVLAAYARTNKLALVALSALTRPGVGEGVAGEGVPTQPPPGPALKLPPLPQALAPEVAALVGRLNELGATRPDAVLATMYRHLTHWPPYLALAWTLLAPAAADGRLAAAIADCRSRASRLAASLPGLRPPPPPRGTEDAVADALERFAGEVLPRMVVVCVALRDATPAAD
jgi:hypothetical protein